MMMDVSDDEFVPEAEQPQKPWRPPKEPKEKARKAAPAKKKKKLPGLTLGRITKIGGSKPVPVPKAPPPAPRRSPPKAPAQAAAPTLKGIYPHCVTTENTDKTYFKECVHLEGHHRLTVSCVATFDNPATHTPLVVTGSDDGLVLVWEPRDGTCIVVLSGHTSWVRCLCTYVDPHHGAAYGGFPRIASGSFDKTVKIWDPLVGGAPVYTIDLPAMATGLLVTVYAKQAYLCLATGGRQEGETTLRIRTMSKEQVIGPPKPGAPPPVPNETKMLVGHSDMVYGMAAFHDRGKPRLVTGSHDNLVKVWDLLTGKELVTLSGHVEGVNCIACAQNGNKPLVASGAFDCSVGIWDPIKGGPPLLVFMNPGAVVTAVAFFADPQTGKCLLASGQSDRTLRVWDPLKGGDYLQQDVLPDKVRAIAPSFDGLCLAVSLGMMFEPERAAAGMFLTA